VRIEYIVLGVILILGAALRMYHIGTASLWSDEIFSRYYLDVFGQHYALHEGLSLETNPPTYYFLLRNWMKWWGESEAALRSLSALASTLCIPFLYLLGRELAGKWRGLLGALLYALCPASLYFAQETRVYAFLMFASAGLLWAAAIFQRDSRSRRAAISYLGFGTLCLYLHATGLLFVAACGTAIGLFLLKRGRRGRAAFWKWTALNVAVMLLGVPYYRHAFTAVQSGIINYVPPAGLHQFIYSSSLVVSGIVTPYPWPGFLLAAALFVTLAVSLWLHPLSSRASVTLIAVPALFIALVFAVSLRRPILLPRVLVWVVVPLCVLVGRQLLLAGRSRFALLLALVAAFGGGLFFQLTAPNDDKEPIRQLMQTMAPQLARADLVVLSPVSNPMLLRYYAPGIKGVRLWDAASNPTIMAAAAKRVHVESISEAGIMQAIRARRTVVVLSHSFDLNRLNDLRKQAPESLYHEWFCGKVPCVAAAAWQPTP
jgi:uncharacterized membrane protein